MFFVVIKLFFTHLELSAKTMCISREVRIITPLWTVCRTHQKWTCFVCCWSWFMPPFSSQNCQCKHNIPKHARNVVVTPVKRGLPWLLTLPARQITSTLSLQVRKVSRWTTAQKMDRTWLPWSPELTTMDLFIWGTSGTMHMHHICHNPWNRYSDKF